MAFEREAIASPAPAPTQPQAEMRQERVVDPYARRMAPKIGQPDNNNSGTPNGLNPKATNAEPEVAAEKSVSLSPAAAALARTEQRLRQDQAALKAREAALEKEKSEISEMRSLREKLAAKDYSAIEGMVPYDEYTNYQVNKLNSMSPEAQALNELKADLEGLKKSQQDDVTKRFEAVVTDRRNAVTKLVESDSQYPGIKHFNAQEHVVQHILDTWEHDQVELTPEQAAREVEELIKEREAKYLEVHKLRNPAAEPVSDKRELPPLKQSVNTLTNNMSATGEIKRPPRSFQGMNDQERWQEARRRAEEKLKG